MKKKEGAKQHTKMSHHRLRNIESEAIFPNQLYQNYNSRNEAAGICKTSIGKRTDLKSGMKSNLSNQINHIAN